MKTVKLNAFDNPFVYGVDNKEYLVFNIDNETQTLKFQSLIGDLKVKTANILFKANSLPAKLYEMVVDDDILTFTLPSVLTGYNSSMYVYLLLNYSDDLSTSDLYTFKLVNKGSSTFNFEISSICESNISTIVSEEIKNEGTAKNILDTVSNYEFDKLQHAQQSLSLVENAFASTLEKRIDLFNSAYDKANETKSSTTADINDSDIDIPSSNTDSDLKDYVENVKKQMAERLKDVTAVSQQIQDEMEQEKQSFLGTSLIFQQDLKQERDIISAYGESTRQHMDQEFNEVKDHADKVFADFSKEIPDLDASIKQVNDKIVATDNKVGTLNTKVTTVENDITELEKMHDEVTQTINNGKPINLYSNSLDFPQGDFDYDSAPNLLKTVTRDNWSNWISSVTTPNSYVKVFDDYIIVDATDPSAVDVGRNVYIPNISRLTKGKQYTLSVTMMVDNDFDAGVYSYNQTAVHYTVQSNGTPERPMIIRPNKTMVNQWQRVSVKFTVPTSIKDGDFCFLHFYEGSKVTGKWYIRNDIMIQEGDQTQNQSPANQMPKIITDDYIFSDPTNVTKIPEEGNITSFNMLPTSQNSRNVYLRNDYGTKPLIPLLSDKKQYTLSAEIWLEKEVNAPVIYGVNDINGTGKVIMVANTVNVPAKQWTKVSTTQTINLPSNPNIANPTKTFPIKTREYLVYSGANTEPYIAGQQYTLTMKATKPVTQTFNVFINEGTIGFGSMTPVEGLTNVWQKKFTVGQNHIDAGVKDRITIYQVPNSSVGDVQIDWLKIEKGDTYTPDYPAHWVQLNAPESYEGIIKIKNDSIKIQEGAKTTKPSWKPNLLDAPYYLGKHEVNKNIANPDVSFPINSSEYLIYKANMKEAFVVGQTYTITLKGTKPVSQTFVAYNDGVINFGNLKPVEGLTDVWSLTFTPTKVASNVPKEFRIFQYPQSTAGACQIDWIKIEKGDYRTPPIEAYKYKGVSLRNTVDPKAFDWQEQTVPDVSTLKEQVNTLTPKVDNSQLFKLTKDDGNTIKVDYMSPKPTSFLALAKNTGFYSISTAEARLMSDYNELPPLLQNTFLFINNYPPRDGFIIQEITGGEISTQLVHKYYRRIEPDGTYKNWNKVITDKDVSKMKTLYSNCIDFGKYDYSGNPNLLPVIDYSQLSGTNSSIQPPPAYVKDRGTYFEVDMGDPSAAGIGRSVFLPLITRLQKGKTYTISANIMISDEMNIAKCPLYYSVYRTLPQPETGRPVVLYPTNDARGKFTRVSKTFTIPSDLTDGDFSPFLHWYFPADAVGKYYVGYDIKIEEGSTATPYQPNLLQDPYNISANDVNKNLVDTRVYSNSNYLIGGFPINTPLSNGDKVTFTLKGTKLATKQFGFYVQTATGAGTEFQGYLVPIEGLANTWSWTGNLKIAQTTTSTAKVVVYQLPPTSQVADGPATIDWAKLEKGETFTPNIERFEYKGISSIETSPNNYYWSAEPFNRSIYSNSVDFGNWDYTGNPNLSAKLNASSFSSGTGATVSDEGDEIVFTLDGTRLTKYKVDTQTPLIQGKIYTISCEILLDSDFVGDPSNIKLQHSFLPGGTIVLQTTTVPSNTLGTWQKLQGTATINYGSGKPKQWYSVFTNIGSNTSTGHIRLRNVKIEEARIATPYQPNLLVAPYYLSKVDLGENIAPNTNLPVTTSSQLITQQTLSSYLVKGETYTVTLEGTKPENQDFSVFIADVGNTKFGDMTPVEGLTNQWELTFTYNKDTQTSGTKEVRIYQRYAELGSCTIKWLKIEKSSVATPNIKEYKYKGFSVKPSNNPNDYEWSIDRRYGEKRLDKMVNTTDPQSIDGTKNFLQVPTVKGNNVLFDEKLLPYEGWYTNGEVLTNLPDKAKLRVGPVVATIGKQYNRSMKDDPLQWNSSRFEATVLRDCTVLIEGFARMQYGSRTSGYYGYLVYYRDSAQTQEIGYVGGTGGSVSNAGGTGDKLQWKQGTPFSRIIELHQGDVFNITFSTSSGAKVDFAEVQTLHVMEIEPL